MFEFLRRIFQTQKPDFVFLLIDRHLLDDQARQRFRSWMVDDGQSPIIAAYWSGLEDEDEFANELAELMDAPRLDVFQSVPTQYSYCRQVVGVNPATISLALVDPTNTHILEHLKNETKRRVIPRTITMKQFSRLEPPASSEYVERLVDVLLVSLVQEGCDGTIHTRGSAIWIDELEDFTIPGLLADPVFERLRVMSNFHEEYGVGGLILRMGNGQSAYFVMDFTPDNLRTRIHVSDEQEFSSIFPDN